MIRLQIYSSYRSSSVKMTTSMLTNVKSSLSILRERWITKIRLKLQLMFRLGELHEIWLPFCDWECRTISDVIVKYYKSGTVPVFLVWNWFRCCKDLELMPNSSFKTKVQFQLDRQMFCLRHYAVDNIGEKIKLLCPSKEHLASLEPISGVKMCNDLDKVQVSVALQIYMF